MEMCICRCCLAAGCDKGLLTAYQHDGVHEVYADMMKETFDIELPDDADTHYICDDCITELRRGYEFKKRALSSLAIFLQHFHQLNKDTKGEISPFKQEAGAGSEDDRGSDNFEVEGLDETLEGKISPFMQEARTASEDEGESDNFEVEVLDETLEEYMQQSSIHTKLKIVEGSVRTLKRKQEEFEPDTAPERCNTEEAIEPGTKKNKTEKQTVKTEGPVFDIEFVEDVDEVTEVAEKRGRQPSDTVIRRIQNAVSIVAHSNACPFHWPLIRQMRFKCYFCASHFMEFPELRRHFVAEHNDIEAFHQEVDRQGVGSPLKIEITDLRCGKCALACDGLESLRAHLTGEHALHFHDEEELLLPLKCERDGYKCLECQTEFPGWVSLNRHIRVTHRVATPRVHECKQCEKRFVNGKSLRRHIKIAHTDGMPNSVALRHNTTSLLENSNMTIFNFEGVTFRCVICQQSFMHFLELLQHSVTHDNAAIQSAVNKSAAIGRHYLKVDITDLKCTKCQKAFDSIDALQGHLSDSHETVFYKKGMHYLVPYFVNGCMKCGVCKKDFTVMQTLTRHVNNHLSKEVCDVCGKAYYNKTMLRTHIRKTHSDIKCAVCNITFESFEARRVHNKDNHKGSLPRRVVKCAFCNETFTYCEPKYAHMKAVHGYQPPEYQCEVCNKVFYTKGGFDNHQYKHKRVGGRATEWVTCKYCSRKFSVKQIVKHITQWHIKSHTFRCDLCKNEFESADRLRRHLIDRHSHKKPQCPLCKFAPKGKAILLLHLEAVHKIDNNIDGVWTFEGGSLVNVKIDNPQ